jgi:hypothetical protein
VVISNEWLSLASREHADRLVRALSPAQVHVVCTARAYVHQVPAAWQETLKLGRTTSLEDFVRDLEREGERWSWSNFDPASVLGRWEGSLPAERLHVVTVPARGADPLVLWHRFAAVCGIDPDSLDTSMGQRNESLSVQGARLVQLLGPALRDAVDADTGHRSESHRWIRNYLANRLLAHAGSGRIGLSSQQLAIVLQRTAETAAHLQARRYEIIGDLAEFLDGVQPSDARPPDQVSAEEILEVAAPIIPALLRRVRAETRRADMAEAALNDLSAQRRPRRKRSSQAIEKLGANETD